MYYCYFRCGDDVCWAFLCMHSNSESLLVFLLSDVGATMMLAPAVILSGWGGPMSARKIYHRMPGRFFLYDPSMFI